MAEDGFIPDSETVDIFIQKVALFMMVQDIIITKENMITEYMEEEDMDTMDMTIIMTILLWKQLMR